MQRCIIYSIASTSSEPSIDERFEHELETNRRNDEIERRSLCIRVCEGPAWSPHMLFSLFFPLLLPPFSKLMLDCSFHFRLTRGNHDVNMIPFCCFCGETQGAAPFVTANGLRLHLIYSEVDFVSGGATICLLVTSCCAPPVNWLPVRTHVFLMDALPLICL